MFNGGETFNEISHFMGTNPLIQYVMQPVLTIGLLFHLIMGMALEVQNRKARNKKYATLETRINTGHTAEEVALIKNGGGDGVLPPVSRTYQQ